MEVLVGDIGATKTELAIYADRKAHKPLVQARYINGEYAAIAEVLEDFLSKAPPVAVRSACLAVAGVVQKGVVKMTNRPWTIEAAAIKAQFSLAQVDLINDLEALAYGVLTLEHGDFETLQVGKPTPHGNKAVIAAGTGLGEAGLFWDGQHYHPVVGEGGLCNFAPQNLEELSFLNRLLQQKEYAVVEDFLSGRGLERLYSYLYGKEKNAETITIEALEGKPSSLQVANQFITLYAAQAGNLALRYLATGGIFIGGGIAKHLLPLMRQGRFVEAFSSHRGLAEVLKKIPIHVITKPRACLQGALLYLQRRDEMRTNRV